MENYYVVLRCNSNASYEEIKRSYHDLALKVHPDKSDSNDRSDSSGSTTTFQDIDEAWKTLRDPIKRKMYDEMLRHRALEEQDLLYGTFTLRDLNYDPASESYSYVCKCGGEYNFTLEGSEEFNSFLVSCDQCSLMILVDVV